MPQRRNTLAPQIHGGLLAAAYPAEGTGTRRGGVAGPAALGVALFGGTAPLIITALQGHGIALAGIALYTVVAALISGTVYARMKETAHQPLT